MGGKSVVLPLYSLLLVAALAGTIVAQGGFYLPGRVLAAALTGAAVVGAVRLRHVASAEGWPLVAACVGLVVWSAGRAAEGHSVETAIPIVASVFCLAGAVFVAQRNDPAQRTMVASVAVGIGVLVAATGWIAVVWRIPSWTTVADGLVRAASTLTYPNASAALLAALALLAVSLQMTRPKSLPHLAATYLLLVGLGATLSRAGVFALLAGIVVLAWLAGVRSTARHVAAPGIGALIGVAGLAPSFPVAQPASPVLAILGLVVGLLVSVGLIRLPAKVLTVVAGVMLVGAVVAVVLGSDRVLNGRVTLSSPDRAGITGAALDVVATRPLTGVGPGNAWFTWTGADGNSRVGRFVHNEYLQALVELGVVGLVLVLCVLVTLLLFVRHGRTTGTRAQWAGAVAGFVALLVHSGFDFLWHIPAVLLTAGVLAGLAGPQNAKETM
ncbi:O-antigen ligase family protein [Actinocrispum sp. NPDC049592]|uniref:O-antigen ligase family protein n=1 Tax=Actinocrispum sp. NPDC049592 TaxID=3154835 RepID=UPI003411FCB3